MPTSHHLQQGDASTYPLENLTLYVSRDFSLTKTEKKERENLFVCVLNNRKCCKLILLLSVKKFRQIKLEGFSNRKKVFLFVLFENILHVQEIWSFLAEQSLLIFPCEKQHPLMNSVLDKKEQTIIAISLKNYPLSHLGRVSYPHTPNAPNIAVVFENQNYD